MLEKINKFLCKIGLLLFFGILVTLVFASEINEDEVLLTDNTNITGTLGVTGAISGEFYGNGTGIEGVGNFMLASGVYNISAGKTIRDTTEELNITINNAGGIILYPNDLLILEFTADNELNPTKELNFDIDMETGITTGSPSTGRISVTTAGLTTAPNILHGKVTYSSTGEDIIGFGHFIVGGADDTIETDTVRVNSSGLESAWNTGIRVSLDGWNEGGGADNTTVIYKLYKLTSKLTDGVDSTTIA